MNFRSAFAACAAVIVTIAAAPGVQAQTLSCSDIRFTDEVLRQFPDAPNFCLNVVEKDGSPFARFNAQFVRRLGADQAVLRFRDPDGRLNAPVSVPVQEGQTVRVGGRDRRVRDLQRGDTLSVYLPADRFELAYADSDEEFVRLTVVFFPISLAPAENPATTLPATASPMPLIGAIGGLFLVMGAGLSWIRRRVTH